MIGEFGGVKAHYRSEGDVRVLNEVLEARCYRRVRAGFDVEEGELWLDLGANIGAFALYCKSRAATAVCYEPAPECFAVLRKNAPKFELHNSAVSVHSSNEVEFYNKDYEYSGARGTLMPVRGYKYEGAVSNVCAQYLVGLRYDGIKMDIEGSEGGLLDKWWLPKCSKLVMEYHTSRDPSTVNLARRLKAIKKRFKSIAYPPEYDRAIASGAAAFHSHFDRMIFAWDPK